MTANRLKTTGKFDLNIYGVRKAEGGARRSAYKPAFHLVRVDVTNIDLYFGI